MPTLKQIDNFLVLAEELHFARAAHKLGISQAALSNEIKKMENSLGCQLIDRSDRWMLKLTEAGVIYLRQIRDLPGTLSAAGQLARKAARGENGTLSIGVAGVVYDYLDIGAMCRNMLQKYPEVKIRLYDTLISPATVSMIRSGQCDIAFFATSNISANLENLCCRKIIDIPLCFAIPSGNPLASKKNLKIEDLKNSHFIFPPKEEAPRLRNHFETFFLSHCKSAPLIVHEVAGVRGSLQLVASGLGIALIPLPPSGINLRNIVLKTIPIGVERYTVAAWDGGNTSKVLRNFISLLPPSSGEKDD